MRLAEASGLPQDSSGNAHHASAVGGTPTYLQEDAILDDPDAYGAMLFGGVSDQFTIPAHAALNTADLTVEAWLKPTTLRIQGIVVKNSASSWRLFMNATSGSIEFDALADAVNCATGANVISAGVWSHVVAVYDSVGQTMKVYLNGGAAKASTAAVASVGGTFNSDLIIAGATVNRWSGGMDEVAFYNTPLSQARIQAHYDEGIRSVFGVATQPRRGRRVRS